MLSCEQCGCRFYKTLDIRFLSAKMAGNTDALVLKKRCKRCKTMTWMKCHGISNALQWSWCSQTVWNQATPVRTKSLYLGKRVSSSEYTQLISQATECVYEQVVARQALFVAQEPGE